MSSALRRQGLVIVATLATAYVASHFFRAANVTIGLDLMRDLAIGPEALGALTGAFFFGFSAMQIPCGFFFDRFGPRRTVVVVGESRTRRVAAAESEQFGVRSVGPQEGTVLGARRRHDRRRASHQRRHQGPEELSLDRVRLTSCSIRWRA